MSDPWDPPLLPSIAESAFDRLFVTIGAFITAWEYVEFKLARIYSVFSGAPDDWRKLQEYGENPIYSQRIQHFLATADRFFVANPNQELEGELAEIRRWCDGFARVRNDIVHGVVFDCATSPELMQATGLPEGAKPQYLLIPPMHTVRKYAVAGSGVGIPLYAYNADMITERFHHLHTLQIRLDNFAGRLWRHAVLPSASRI